MHTLVRAILNRDLQTPWGQYSVRPPRVGEALILLAATEDEIGVFWEVLTDWLPPELVERFRSQPTGDVVQYVERMLGEGMPAFSKNGEVDDEKPVYRSRDDWEDLVADYMHVYGVSASQVLGESWSAFLLFASKISQVTARDQYRYLQARSIPWIKGKEEQEQAFRDLIERGKLPVIDKEAERARKLRMQPKWLKDLDAEFEIIRNNPRA